MSSSNLRHFKDYAGAFSNEGGLPPGGEPPDNAGMELTNRVAHLETGMTEVKTRLDSMQSRLDRVEVRLEHIEREVSNTKWWILGQIVAGLLTVVGTGIAIQQMTVATFQAAGAQPAPAQAAPIIIQVPTQAPAATKP